MKNRKEELEKELEYIKSVLEHMSQYDGERSFYCYQKYEIEKELEELNNEGQN